ncbi:dirigent protein 24-like [Cucurbita moschata]|uniref:Dirigent protein n=1 Tax=Cucurbita moschata TaxID=3662 RepID=A0A6J1GY33_CUCMO|nr:dirigent protein 24-like [Cucurbita moschata]
MAKIPLFFFVVLCLGFSGLRSSTSARLLMDDEVDAESLPQPAAVSPPLSTIPAPAATSPATQVGTTTLPSTTGSQIPATTPTPAATNDEEDDDTAVPQTNPPVAAANNQGPTEDDEEDDNSATPAAAAVPTSTPPTKPLPAAAAVGVGVTGTEPISFYMHDILGGSHPSARVVTGVIANSDDSGLAFSKPNDNLFPIQGTLPLLNNDNLKNIINNNNNLPFLAGFNGASQGNNLLLQNSANNGILNGDEDSQPFVTAGQLPSRVTLQQLMFGSVTVVDDELTESHELGSAVVGRAQGFYLASSLDGTSQTVALTALFHGGGHDHVAEDSISFFGVHRTAAKDSQIAVVGGTGKYENARGYATVEMLHHEVDQHTTDGVDTIVHFSVYLSEE